ncbi:MAG: ATP-grasp domain-containing protein [Mycobacteriaceae bacterium]|nr:ATP-grasp domain-containing protein [Mycobacteriaceae bacterium]
MTSGAVTSVLVANRGEIARRVFRTCRELGIGTVAVFSDTDASSPHVAEADSAVRLPGSTSAETYLRGDLVIAAARAAGADAVHPGYGFLSENAEFAEAVLAAGLTWIGPTPESVRAMGSKVEAKKLMDAAGVPVLAELAPDAVAAADLPVLVKASAGGGGRGMRVVRTLDTLADDIAAARREAASAFGDPTVFCERYLETGRHIEVQVLADAHGGVWIVGERECSIQRRHQKVIEEAPSPLVERTPGMRERLFTAARAAVEAIGYLGAGTVEFLADESGGFYFLEMNTRLQVEHPVTELVTGLDLVELQLRVAAGERLPDVPPATAGHAVEARLYAEDPALDWQPQSGTIHRITVEGSGIRLDSGVEDGSRVSVFYDPMLAKVIGYGPDRATAAARLATALAHGRIHGLTTNRDLLVRVLRHPAFLAGDTTTAFFATHDLAALSAPLAGAQAEALSAVAAALAEAAANHAASPVNRALPSGWRNLAAHPLCKRYTGRAGVHEVRYRRVRVGLAVDDHAGLAVVSTAPDRVVLEVDGVRRGFEVARYGQLVHVDSPLGPVSLVSAPRFVEPGATAAEGSLLAPMPGAVIRIGVSVGDQVAKGAPLLWLEAMKMEHTIAAPCDGTVRELPAAVGAQVELGAVLAVVTPNEDE